MLQDHASPRASALGEAPNAAQCSDNQVDVRSAVETPPANIDKATAVVPIQGTRFSAFIREVLQGRRLVLCLRTGDAHIVVSGKRNPFALPVASGACNALIRQAAIPHGFLPRRHDLTDINEHLRALAVQNGEVEDIWTRVAPVPGGLGVIIDLGDDE